MAIARLVPALMAFALGFGTIPANADERLNYVGEAAVLATACADYLFGKPGADALKRDGYGTVNERKRTATYRKPAPGGKRFGTATARLAIGFGKKPFCELKLLFLTPQEAQASVGALVREFEALGFSASGKSGFWHQGHTFLRYADTTMNVYSVYYSDGSLLKMTVGQKK